MPGFRNAVKSESKVSDSTGGNSAAGSAVVVDGGVAAAADEATLGDDAAGGAVSSADASLRRDQRAREKRSVPTGFVIGGDPPRLRREAGLRLRTIRCASPSSAARAGNAWPRTIPSPPAVLRASAQH